MAEAWAIYDALLYAWKFCFSCIILESNSKEIVDILHGHSVSLRGCSLISMIEKLINRNWFVQVQHVYRERNLVADRLASLSRNLPLGVTEWKQVLDQVASLISCEVEVC
ncbi:hypothetical protein V6N11_053728 [Hibiscus sabdariffa]|uniref:RNase H type-1 domain-containing protein n=1 Tax=Hibiscus sabdariffa TaxID=183260 RepID=A0ABR2S1Q9_9ROSI